MNKMTNTTTSAPWYEQIAQVKAVLAANPTTWFTPSAVARKVKGLTTYYAFQTLRILEANGEAISTGNGSWKKWRSN